MILKILDVLLTILAGLVAGIAGAIAVLQIGRASCRERVFRAV